MGVGLPHFLGAFFGPKTRFLPWNKFFFVNSPALMFRFKEVPHQYINFFTLLDYQRSQKKNWMFLVIRTFYRLESHFTVMFDALKYPYTGAKVLEYAKD